MKDEQDAQLAWIEEQLQKAAPEEKFFTMMHIYETAGWWSGAFENWKEDSYQKSFFDIMLKYREKIIFQVTGHDHLSDLRTAKVDGSEDEYYMNKVVFPGLTSTSLQQPGYASFMYDTDTAKATNLMMSFVSIDKTIGMPENTTYDKLPWFDVDFD